MRWYLIDGDNVLADALEGGGIFSTGVFKLHQTHVTSLDFEFFSNDCVYRISVLPEPRFRFVLAPGWFYSRRLYRHRLVVDTVESGAV